MEHIIDEFGAAFLAMIASGAALGLVAQCMQEGGVFYMAVTAFLYNICG